MPLIKEDDGLTKDQRYIKNHHDRILKRKRDRYKKYRDQELGAYRRFKLSMFDLLGGRSCALCGDSTLEHLSVDHVNNDGAKERRAKGGDLTTIYRRILRGELDKENYRVLCYNCNCSLGFSGYTPEGAMQTLYCE